MKKILLVVFLLVITVGTTSAQINTVPQSVGVILIGTSDFRTPDYYDILNGRLPKLFVSEKYRLSVGAEPQGKYQQYWDIKGFLVEQPATRDDLLAFAKFSNYDYVLYLVVSQPVMETHKYSVFKDITRASIDVRAIIVNANQQTIISNQTITQQDDSLQSQLRAKRGAFSKSIDYLVNNTKLQ